MQSMLCLRPTLRSVSSCVKHASTRSTSRDFNIAQTLDKLKTQQAMTEKKFSKQKFKYFLVVDFEATCNRQGPPPEPQEIIEFPVIQLSATTFKEVARFHSYVQPDVHKELSDFCTELTGIVQSMVDDQPILSVVLARFDLWMRNNDITPQNSAAVTFGNWDLGSMLPRQCSFLDIEVPPIFRFWINLKQSFHYQIGQWPLNMQAALSMSGLRPYGRAHSGIDDVLNMIQLMSYIAEKGHVFDYTGRNKRYSGPDPRLYEM